MDSLLASYASSSDDEKEQPQKSPSSSTNHTSHKSSQPSSDYFNTENPKSSSLIFNLPKPKSSSVFSSLPPPTSKNPKEAPTKLSSSIPKPKKVIQFRPPINPYLLKTLDDDDEEEEREKAERRKKESISLTETSSVKSFFSNLPAPKNSLGLGSSFGATGRRSIVDTNVVESSNSNEIEIEKSEITTTEQTNFQESVGHSFGGPSSENSETLNSFIDSSNWYQNSGNHENYPNYVNYENYDCSYQNHEYDRSATMVAPMTTGPEIPDVMENVARLQGKRSRKEIPTEFVEVKMDDLMKNRPREDQARANGIAFGPSYQPVSNAAKPSKLHKRKHQISTLYHDMKQKAMELSERRAKGFLTKAETQAKYGW